MGGGGGGGGGGGISKLHFREWSANIVYGRLPGYLGAVLGLGFYPQYKYQLVRHRLISLSVYPLLQNA